MPAIPLCRVCLPESRGKSIGYDFKGTIRPSERRNSSMKTFIKLVGIVSGGILLCKAIQVAVDYLVSTYSARYVRSEVDGLNDYQSQI